MFGLSLHPVSFYPAQVDRLGNQHLPQLFGENVVFLRVPSDPWDVALWTQPMKWQIHSGHFICKGGHSITPAGPKQAMGRKSFLTNEIYKCGILLKDQHQCFLISSYHAHIRVHKTNWTLFIEKQSQTMSYPTFIYRLNSCLRLQGQTFCKDRCNRAGVSEYWLTAAENTFQWRESFIHFSRMRCPAWKVNGFPGIWSICIHPTVTVLQCSLFEIQLTEGSYPELSCKTSLKPKILWI